MNYLITSESYSNQAQVELPMWSFDYSQVIISGGAEYTHSYLQSWVDFDSVTDWVDDESNEDRSNWIEVTDVDTDPYGLDGPFPWPDMDETII